MEDFNGSSIKYNVSINYTSEVEDEEDATPTNMWPLASSSVSAATDSSCHLWTLLSVFSWIKSEVSSVIFGVFLILPFPLFIFFLFGTVKALSAAISVAPDEKRRIKKQGVMIPLLRFYRKMADFYINSTSVDESYNNSTIESDYERNISDIIRIILKASFIRNVVFCIIISISLPLTLVAIYGLYSQVRNGHVAPIYVINLLISDIIQLCSMIIDMATPKTIIIIKTLISIYIYCLMTSVSFMVCVALESFGVHPEAMLIIFAVFFFLPLPLFIFFLFGTIKALSAAISVPPDENDELFHWKMEDSYINNTSLNRSYNGGVIYRIIIHSFNRDFMFYRKMEDFEINNTSVAESYNNNDTDNDYEESDSTILKLIFIENVVMCIIISVGLLLTLVAIYGLYSQVRNGHVAPIYVINLLISDIIQICSLIVYVAEPENYFIEGISDFTYNVGLMASVCFMVCVALERFNRKMEDFDINNTSVDESYNYSYTDYESEGNNSNTLKLLFIEQVVFYIVTTISLPLTLVAIYRLYSQVKNGHVAPIYIINLLISDIIQLCSMIVDVAEPENDIIEGISDFTYLVGLTASVGFMVLVALKRFYGKMEDFYINNTSVDESYNNIDIDHEHEGNNCNIMEPLSIKDATNVATCIIISVGLPLTLVAIYGLYSQVRNGHVAPIYIINLLISDIIQLCSMIVDVAAREHVIIKTIASFTYNVGLMASVCFMVCVALERYLVIAWPLWYRFRRNIKTSVVVSAVVWIITLVFVVSVVSCIEYEVSSVIIAVFLLLPFPLFIFFLFGTIKALSAAISVPPDEKQRIVAILVLVLLIYTLLFLPTIIWQLALGGFYRKMEDFYINNTSVDESYNNRDIDYGYKRNNFMKALFIRKVVLCIITSVGLPLTLLAIYGLYSQVRNGHVAPIYIINLLISDIIQLCSMIVYVAKPENVIIVTIADFTYFVGLIPSVSFMVCIALERFYRKMEDFYIDNTSVAESYNNSYIDHENERNNSNIREPLSVGDVVTCIVTSISLLLTVVAIYGLYSQVRNGHVAPIYIINLLISDIIQLCSMIVDVAAREHVIIKTIASFTYNVGLMASVCFMVCVALERYLVIAWPLWYRFRRNIKTSVVVCAVVWIVALVFVVSVFSWIKSEVSSVIFGVLLLLPLPLFIFFLFGTIKSLSAAISVPPDEKRRIVQSSCRLVSLCFQ
ncbi:hypothetical protein INR49_030859 [Caranx melampygus]|nr:hypothetical protein INR49_030859 [Caranx melampygus]